MLIYRFSSNLFFANIQVLQSDIEDNLREDTKAVILDASGIGSMDITAADRLKLLYESLKEKNIRFYITEHIARLNEQMRQLGLGCLIQEGCVRRTTHIALKDMGITRPYPLEGGVDNEQRSASRKTCRQQGAGICLGRLEVRQERRSNDRSGVRLNS